MKFYGHQKEGRLKIEERRALFKYLKKQGDKVLVIEIKPNRGRRSNQANRYYWGVVVELIRNQLQTDWGEPVSREQVHDILVYKFASEEKLIGIDEIIRLQGSTSKMDTREFWRYVENCRLWATSTLNIQIPSSDAEE